MEIDATWAPSANWLLSASFALVGAEFDKWIAEVGDPNNPGQLISVDATDDEFGFTPERSATATASYTLPVDYSLGDMTLTGSIYWQEDMVNFAIPSQCEFTVPAGPLREAAYDSIEVKSYSVMNLRFDWRNMMNSSFDSSLAVNNVTDKEYVIGGFNQIDSLGLVELAYGPPRTVVDTLQYNF